MDVPAQKIIETSGWLPHLHFPGGLDLPTYHVTISFAFCLSLLWLVKRAEKLGLDRHFALDASLAIMMGGFVGARALHILYEAPMTYFADPRQIYRIWEGGFVWYGGALLGTASGIVLALKRKIPLEPYFDLFAPVAAIGYAIGRVACVLTGCCFGRLCVLNEQLAFRYPTQLFAVLWELLTVGILLRLEKRRASPSLDQTLGDRESRGRQAGLLASVNKISSKPGSLLGLWVFLHAFGRILMELFRTDDRGPTVFGLSVSTSISLLLLVGAAIYLRRTP